MTVSRDAIFQQIFQQKPVVPEKSTHKISEIYGSRTFNLREMEQRLPKEAFEAIQKVIENRARLDAKLATTFVEAAKAWAMSHGVTHFSHWFQPMTGLTAEKHDSFLAYDGRGGVIEKFSAAQLIQSEPDASSFPSGGTRSTFEARGYTAWDVSSPLFIVEHAGAHILCIPSVFVSYTGQSLDTKTSLLRSIEILSQAGCALLQEMGETGVTSVTPTLGCEQEYFLIDRRFVTSRPDLLLTGRTLIGADMPKGQQLEDHYFGAIPGRVQAFMADVENELYRLGVPIKTRHNEVAPSQFEMAPIFEESNVASDHNMLMMEVLRRFAKKHGFSCLLHEKPFAGINGSGKHNNWSMATNTGGNLLDPSQTPNENIRFIAVLSCVLRAVHKHQVALRASIATHGNDHRLGANEAPPAIISVFLGSTLSEILETLEKGGDLSRLAAEQAFIEFNLNRLPALPKDNTDRNRTSPFAFTGNKFEFRAVGSSQNPSLPISFLNAAVAESFREFTSLLKEHKKDAASRESAILEVAQKFIVESRTIRFEGNGYSEEWRAEAKKRGLYELRKSPEALEAFMKKEAHEFLVTTGVYRAEEIEAWTHISLERYAKYIEIEGRTLLTLARQYVLPAAYAFQKELAETLSALSPHNVASRSQKELLREISDGVEQAALRVRTLEQEIHQACQESEALAQAKRFGHQVSEAMATLRDACDGLEVHVPADLWELPKYREMLFIR